MTFPALFSSILIIGIVSSGAAQQSPTYAEEYALYQQAQGAANISEQKDLALQFVQKFKASELDAHISYLYMNYLGQFQQKSDWESLAREAEKFLQYRPGDANAAAMAVEAYRRLGQTEKLVQFGSRLYGQAPSGATAYLVANAYQAMGDTPNYLKWAERTLQHDPKNAEMLVGLAYYSYASNDFAKASAYGERALRALEGKGDDVQTNQKRAFACLAMGQKAYLDGDNSTAQKHFLDSTKYDPKNDFAHLQLGYCQWRTGRIDDAIMSFARAVALKGSEARQARQELYNLLKTRYGNTENATRMISAAAKELGIS